MNKQKTTPSCSPEVRALAVRIVSEHAADPSQWAAIMFIKQRGNREAKTMTRIHQGWRELHPDVSLNFQLNRWAGYGGEAWLHDVEPILPRLVGYDEWRDEFVRLGEAAEREGRLYAAAVWRVVRRRDAISDSRRSHAKPGALAIPSCSFFGG